MQNRKDHLYCITMNFNVNKHKELIEWLQSLADREEQSLSSLCIKCLKLYYEEHYDGNGTNKQ